MPKQITIKDSVVEILSNVGNASMSNSIKIESLFETAKNPLHFQLAFAKLKVLFPELSGTFDELSLFLEKLFNLEIMITNPETRQRVIALGQKNAMKLRRWMEDQVI